MKTQLLPLVNVDHGLTSSSVHISGLSSYRDDGDLRAIFVNAIPFFLYPRGDLASERFAMIHLIDSGIANQQEVAAAFGYSRVSIFRAKKQYDEGGTAALVPKKRGPRSGSRVNGAVAKQVLALKGQGLTNTAIGVRLGLKESTIRMALKRLGWCPAVVGTQEEIPFAAPTVEPDILPGCKATVGNSTFEAMAAECVGECDPPLAQTAPTVEPQPVEIREPFPAERSFDSDPENRLVDRAFARLGLLKDAAPFFKNATDIPYVGALLAVPAILDSGILQAVKETYRSIGPSFYGMRTIFFTMLFMALLRIKRPETLKEHSPAALGRILGLDRACEMKTLRGKLDRLASQYRAGFLGRQLAKTRVRRCNDVLGFLYVDGHVRVYHGKRRLGKAYVTQRRLAMPGTTDYWVNDQVGSPVFVITAPANDGLVAMLPSIAAGIRDLVGDREITIVFDRGGWSPKLFLELIANRFHVLTYRKGKVEPIPEECFIDMTEHIDGKKVEYRLHDRSEAFLKGGLWLRQVTRLNPSGHQTHIVTSRQDLSAVTIAYRMFERWRQENFFKYMSAEYALDALVDYDVDEDDPDRLVPNPARKEILRERQKTKEEIAGLERAYGLEAMDNQESRRPTMRGFKIANSAIRKRIAELTGKEDDLKAGYRATPAKIPLNERYDDGITPQKLRYEKKHLTDLIKMVAYQAETDLFAMITTFYARAEDEGRTLIQSALNSAGDLEVDGTELRVRLNTLSSPHRTKAIRKLCAELNKTGTVFPASGLRLVFDVKDHGHVSQK